MDDKKQDSVYYSLPDYFYSFSDSGDQHYLTETSLRKNENLVSFFSASNIVLVDSLVKWKNSAIPKEKPDVNRILASLYRIFGNPENEEEFQQLKSKIHSQGGELHEALKTLDIIDAKAQSLLSYISISIAALVVLLSQIQNNSILKFIFFDEKFMSILLLLSVFLTTSMILCLYCVNIIGAHTINHLKFNEPEKRLKEFGQVIINITLYRRIMYLFAYYLSFVTAFCLGVLFILWSIGNLYSIHV
jgi:hypothetical protein